MKFALDSHPRKVYKQGQQKIFIKVVILGFTDGFNESIGIIISGLIVPPIVFALANSLKPLGLQYYLMFLGFCGLLDLASNIFTIASYPITNISYTFGWILGILLFADSGLITIIGILYLIAVPIVAYLLTAKSGGH